MTLRIRRVLYLSAFVLFFLVSPTLIFYAAGYRYDIAHRNITTVGAFYVKSYPSGSSIYINGKKTNKRTPTRILNLLPGEYRVSVKRDGFKTWEKELTIASGQTTFVRDIVLFLETQPVQTLSSGGTNVIVSQDETGYAYLDASSAIHLTSLISESDFTIPTEPSPDSLVAISPSADTILFSHEKKWYKLDVNTEKSSLVGPAPLKTTKVFWDRSNPATVWHLGNGTLSLINLSTGSIEQKLASVNDFIFDQNNLFTIKRQKTTMELDGYAAGSLEPSWHMELPVSENVRLVEANNNGLLTLASDRTIWLIDTASNETKQFEAEYFDWHNEKLLIATSFELSYYNHDTKETVLIDRSSEPLNALRWHPSGSYFVRQKGSNLSLVEIDGRDVRNTTPLSIETDDAAAMVFNKKGSRLFVLEPGQNRRITLQ